MSQVAAEPPLKKIPVPLSIAKLPQPSWKRTLDFVVVGLISPVLLPIRALVAVYIRLVSPGPVLFVQSRVGHGGEDFRIYKFRTMKVSKVGRDSAHREYVASRAATAAPLVKPDFKSELIPGGGILRKLSLDELPQVFNVLQGNMSLVGPRPDLLQLADYKKKQTRRFEVLPGMTGLWQVSGKNSLSFEQMIDLDLQYIESMSLWQDLRILAKTFWVVLFDRNE